MRNLRSLPNIRTAIRICIGKKELVSVTYVYQPRPQGFSLKKWAGPTHFFKGKALGTRLGVSVLGRILERGMKNWPISRTGYQFKGNFSSERGANLDSGRHIPTQKIPECPPRGPLERSRSIHSLPSSHVCCVTPNNPSRKT